MNYGELNLGSIIRPPISKLRWEKNQTANMGHRWTREVKFRTSDLVSPVHSVAVKACNSSIAGNDFICIIHIYFLLD